MNPNEDIIEEEPYRADSLRENTQIAQYENQEKARLQKQKQKIGGVINRNKTSNSGKQLTFSTFALMFLVAIFFDSIKFIINLIPFVGGFLEDVTITPAATFTFFIWLKMHGINFTKGPRGFFFLLTVVLSFIPIINALPEWSLFIIGLYLSESKISTSMQKSLKKVQGK